MYYMIVERCYMHVHDGSYDQEGHADILIIRQYDRRLLWTALFSAIECSRMQSEYINHGA